MYDVRRKCDKSKDKDGPVSSFNYMALTRTQADLAALLQGNGVDGDVPEQA
jgi:hypothetical protein